MNWFSSSSKYNVFPKPNFSRAFALSLESKSMEISNELDSGIQTSSADRLFEIFSEYSDGFKGFQFDKNYLDNLYLNE